MEAAEAFAEADLPSPEEEAWRYSRVTDLDLDRWELDSAEASESSDEVAHDTGESATVTVVDGRIASVHVPADWGAHGVVVAPARDLGEGEAALGAATTEPPDVFATMNDAFAADPLVVSVPRGVALDRPIVVRHVVSTEGIAVFPRLLVRLGEGSSATVVDRIESGPETVLSVPFTELVVARGAQLRFASVQQLGSAAWQLGSLVADVAQEADLKVGLVALGGEYARLRTDCRLSGRGANGDLLAAYFGDGHQTLDFRTFQHHDAPDTTSNLLFKGAVGGHSRSVYTGLIRVDKEARGTNAFQTNRNVKLSEDAWAESVPNLEIETNDVRCSHASTVGPVDPEQRFYLESRGVPPHTADRLILAGFFDEVVRQLPGPGLAAEVREQVAAKLDRVAEDLS